LNYDANPDLARMERENIEATHLLMTPIRMIAGFFKVCAFILGLFYLLFLNQVGWITDLGPRSERARMAAIEDIHLDDGYPFADIDIDFRNRASLYEAEHLGDIPWEARDHFWVKTRRVYITQDEEDRVHTITSFAIVMDAGRGTPDRGIPFCHMGLPGIFDTSLGSWGDRGEPELMLDRKSARMRRDYETAAIMVSALRGTLAHLKLHQTTAGMYGPDATDKPLANSFCNAEGADPEVYTPGEIAAFKSATYTIHLDHAPIVRFRYVGFPVYFPSDPDDPVVAKSQRREEGFMKLTGMCDLGDDTSLVNVCSGPDDALMYSTSYVADIFAQNPPLNERQMHAEEAILKTATVQFWEDAARQNGVTNLHAVDQAHDRAEKALAAVLGDK